MAERRNQDAGLLDAMMADLGGPRTAKLLERLSVAVDWKRVAAPIRRLPEYAPRTGAGRPAWPAETMVRCVMLAKWYGLSDPGLEEALKDRISFRRFAGLSFTDRTPDETTFVNFRKRLRGANLDEAIFKAINRQLEDKGLLVREGTLVDATVVEASRGRDRRDGTTTRDPEASITVKGGRPQFGYKGHLAVDLSGIITDVRFSTASDHDSRHIDDLIERERIMVVADSAYSDARRRQRLRRRGVTDGIIHKRVRGQPALRPEQKRHNAKFARLRARVEHPIAMLKQQCGLRRVRYRGRRRNEFDFRLTAAACNLKRCLSLAGI